MAESKKCAHPACNCQGTHDGAYRPYCKDAGDSVELSCNCGHAGCAEELTHRA